MRSYFRSSCCRAHVAHFGCQVDPIREEAKKKNEKRNYAPVNISERQHRAIVPTKRIDDDDDRRTSSMPRHGHRRHLRLGIANIDATAHDDYGHDDAAAASARVRVLVALLDYRRVGRRRGAAAGHRRRVEGDVHAG